MTKRRDRSGRSSVTVKKKRSADTEQLMLCGCTPLSAWWTVSANFGARGGECLRLERMTPPQTNLGLSH